MSSSEITEKDRKLAAQCEACTLCVKARENQSGFFFWFVKFVEGGVCPACKAYERVYGRPTSPFPLETE